MDGKFSKIPIPCVVRFVLVLNYFQPPPTSTRPPVIGYMVSYNMNETVQMYTTNDTVFTIEIPVPNVFNLTVFAFNILGKGEGIDVNSELSVL